MQVPPHLPYHEFAIPMADGTLVRFAPVTPQHKQLILDGFHKLSAASRYMRFGHPVNELSGKELDYLTNVDQQHHVAWGAMVSENGQDCGIAVARYVRTVEILGKAEFALTVLDAYQNRGIGRFMLALLYVLALRQGIHTLSGSIMPTNGHAAEIMQSLGASITVEQGLYYTNLPILADWAKLTTPYGQKFAETLAIISAKLDAQNLD